MLFDRICRENAISHRLTRPASPTTTGKVERFHQTLRRELLNDHPPFATIADAQAAIDAFVNTYNTARPHQSLDMQHPIDRFTARPADNELPLRLPPQLAMPAVHAAEQPETSRPAPPTARHPEKLAVEVTRVVPASANLAVCGQQFWLGPTNAGITITLWADTTVIHLMLAGTRIKTVPSRLTPSHLQQLLADGGRPAGPPPRRSPGSRSANHSAHAAVNRHNDRMPADDTQPTGSPPPKLPAGATGFGPPPPGDPEHPRRALLAACHEAARTIGGTVITTIAPGVTPNFHTVILGYRDEQIAVIGHNLLPLAALTEPAAHGDMQVTFLDHPALMAALATATDLHVMTTEELRTPIASADLTALTRAEHDQIKYWAPDTVGELLFNHWD